MERFLMEKIKVLAWGDFCCSTGFSTVMSNIWKRLDATGKYDLDVVGINYSGDPYDKEKFPGNVFTAMSALNLKPPYNDPYGRQKLLDILSAGQYDIVFLLQDTFILQTIMPQLLELQSTLEKPFKTVYYYPIDATPKRDWITEAVVPTNYPVAYTQYGYDECVKIDPSLADRLSIIYHGNSFDNYNYIEDRESVKAFRNSAFRGETDNKFLIVNVNRNQRRKDVARSLMILKEIKDRGINDVILYMHMAHEDVGGNIIDMANSLDLKMGVDYVVPENFSVHSGFPEEVVNFIYNSADAFLTTTHGEGWGLSVTEAMSTKTPIVAPNNTSLTEMLADNRAFLIDSGADPSMWIIKDSDNDRLRPLMDVKQAADRLIDIKNGILPDIEGAYEWVSNLTWDNIAKQWEDLIDKAHSEPLVKAYVGLNREQRRKNKVK
jgi:glycosyltransferase involved in cell wall biosynthesis